MEPGAPGTMGGRVGTGLGASTVIAVAPVRDRTPVVHTGTVVAAPVVGLVTGVVAGPHPARRASRIEPAEALRGWSPVRRRAVAPPRSDGPWPCRGTGQRMRTAPEGVSQSMECWTTPLEGFCAPTYWPPPT
ncbi:hypothetical protein GCM10010275_32500 [Streptomyces litmocidini]|nr:hypothetical protein GCM10010275_32500 [Streptomyces litmocidini]